MSTFSLVVLFCFFFSGLASLIYQILWLRMIDKVVGSAPFAVATVLSVFMGGLALGSWLAGKYIDRISSKRNLLSLYGKVEFAIGIYGLLLPFLIHMAKPVYMLAYNTLFLHFWLYQIFTFFGCSLLLLVPTTLMGMTLPVLCRFYVEDLGHIGARTGRLYGINTIGGAAGAVLCGFFLIAAFGVWGTIFTAVGINIFIGLLCVYVARGERPLVSERMGKRKRTDKPKVPEHTEVIPLEYDGTVTWALWIFGISGFCSMAYEVFWTRLLGLIIGPTTYSFSLVVSTFIVGLAIGNILFGRMADRVKGVFRLLVITQGCAACLALLVSQFLGNSQFFFSKLIYTFQGNFGDKILVQSIALFFVLVGPTVFLGATFPLVSRIYARSLPAIGRSIGTAYAMNTIGAVLGSFVAGFIFIPLLGKENGLRVVAGLQFFVSLLALTYLIFRTGERIRAAVTGLMTILLGLLLLMSFPSWNHNILYRGWYYRSETLKDYFSTTSWFEAVWKGTSKFAQLMANNDVVFYGDGIGGFTTVVKSYSTTGRVNYNLLNSGKVDASSHGDRLTQAISAHIPLLFHPDPEKVMVVGLASGMTVGEVLDYPVKQVDVLEINDQVVKAAEFFNPWNNDCLTNPRTRIIVQDGRNHLELTNEKYDVIISEPSNPWMAGLANLFTLEFFKTVKGRLSENGIFIQWFHSYEMDRPTFEMIGRTFAEVFPDGLLMKTFSTDFLLVGFSGKKNLDLKTADKNIAYARQSKNITISDPRVIFNLIVSEDLKGFFGPGPFHTDNWPRLEFAAPKNLDKTDNSIEDHIKNNSRLSKETKEIVESNKNLDLSLDWLELMTADRTPPFRDVDLNKATPAQVEKYQGILKQYCSEEDIENYSIFPGTDLQKQCARLQAGKLQDRLASGHENGNVYYYLAKAFRVISKTGEEINALQNAIALDPTSYDAYMELGVILGTQGRFDEAITQFSEALRLKPTSAVAYNNLGNVFSSKGDTSTAIYNYNKALEIDPNNAKMHSNLGLVFAKQGKTDEAIEQYSKALQLNPDFAEAHNNLGDVLKVQGKTEEAINHYSKALQIEPGNAKIRYKLGGLFAGQGRLEEALAQYYETLKTDQNNADVQNDIGTILSTQGKISDAIEHFDAALKINQNHFLAFYNLGVALLKQGKFEAAAGIFLKARELNPNYPDVYKSLGITMGSMGRFQVAASYFSEALKLKPDSAENHDNLGVALAQMGQLDEAVRHFKKALEINNSLEIARDHLKIVEQKIERGRGLPDLSTRPR
jgi:spermidine synthase